MLDTRSARGARMVTRRGLRMSVAICGGTLTALFLNIAVTGGAPINAVSHSYMLTLG